MGDSRLTRAWRWRATDPRLLAGLGAITLLGGLLRFGTLSQTIWADEALSIRHVSGGVGELARRLTDGSDPSPPLYFACLWVWRRLFGDSAVEMRTLSALCGTLLIPVVFSCSLRWLGRSRALAAAALTASSPFLLFYSQELRPYALAGLLAGLGFLAFLRAHEQPTRRRLIAWAALALLSAATHYFALAVVAAEAAVLLRPGADARSRPARAITVLTTAVAGAGLMVFYEYQAHRPEPRAVAALFTSPFARRPVNTASSHLSGSATHDIVQWVKQLVIGPGGPAKTAALATCGLLILLGLWRLWRARDDPHRAGAVLALAVAAPTLLAALLLPFLHVAVWARYLISAWTPLALALGFGLTAGATPVGRLAPLIALCVIWVTLGVATAVTPAFGARLDARGLAGALGAASTPRLIAVDQPLVVWPLLLYRPTARVYGGARISLRELDVVSMAPGSASGLSDIDRPPRPRLRGLPRELRLSAVVRGATYVLERYVAVRPAIIELAPAGGVFSTSWLFVYEPRGSTRGRFG